MKKKYLTLIIILLGLILLTSCNITEGDIKGKIKAPVNEVSPIQGKWKIREKLDGNKEESSIEKGDLYIGNEGLFRREAVIIGKDYTTAPSFRIKSVNLEDYLYYKYNKSYKELGLEQQKAKVINIANDGQSFYEVIRINQDEMLIYLDDNFYMMEKETEEVSLEEIERYIEVEMSMIQTLESWDSEDLKTGLLLGIKTPTYDEVNDVYDWNYETIWINSKDRKVQSSYRVEDLLLPRKNGFWTVSVNRKVDEGIVTDIISSTPQIGSSNKDNIAAEEEEDGFFDLRKRRKDKDNDLIQNIQFLGNDHISVERIEIDGDEKERRVFETYTLDNLADRRPIKLSDILGEDDGKRIFTEGAESIIKITDEVSVNETNFAIGRREGYWIFKGRVNYVENEAELYKDFNLKAIPPINIVRYDKLAMTWNDVVSNIYMAEDVFSSPNEDIIVVKRNNKLLVFSILNGNFESKEPLKVIELANNSSIIMAEWATGRYPELWEREVIKREGILLE